jgi:hypothetical protein
MLLDTFSEMSRDNDLSGTFHFTGQHDAMCF